MLGSFGTGSGSLLRVDVNILPVALLFFFVGLSMGQDTPRTIVTPDFFNGLIQGGCPGSSFYTYDAFINAAETYPGFGTTGGSEIQRRELAAFLANAMHETGSFCSINEKETTDIRCDQSRTDYPCAPGKSYAGRGPLQLTWNYNYGAAGKDPSINLDLLNNPEIVAENVDVSFKTAVWFWMSNSNAHNGITGGGGFASTILAINSGECTEPTQDHRNQVASRVQFYQRFCQKFGVDPGTNQSCY